MKKRGIVFFGASVSSRSALKLIGHYRLIIQTGAISFNKTADIIKEKEPFLCWQ
jgi:hypothetical protein